jgi:RNA polymerase sigma factor (sigma-70 family)
MTSPSDRCSAARQGLEFDGATHVAAGVSDPDLFGRHWVTVEQAIRGVCRRHRFLAEDAEDFTSMVCVRLLEDDCAVLRRFGGRSSLGTYLTAVITHLAQDWRNARWGKWRPSMAARRRGGVAVHLDRLLQRDGFTLDEACETLRTNYQVDESRSELEAIAAALPSRVRRRFIEWTALEYEDIWVAVQDAVADPFVPERAQVLTEVLTGALRSLSAEERLLVKLRFEDGLRIVDIARTLHHPEKPLYRRLERILLKLRRELERRGLQGDSLQQILDHGGASFTEGALRAAFAGVDSWAVAPDAVN